MPARKAPRPAKKSKSCPLCRRASDNPGGPCSACIALPSRDAARRIAERVRDRIQGDEPKDGFVCPFCRAELNWQTLGYSETEVTIYVREKIYFCPSCRSMLGVSSWHTEG